MKSKAIQSANLHASTTHAQAKADAVEWKAEQPRPTLTFDGCGINGPDEYRTRLATFTNREEGKMWGPLLAAAPELLGALAGFVTLYRNGQLQIEGDTGNDPLVLMAESAISKAKGTL